jgi:hypothetical protein
MAFNAFLGNIFDKVGTALNLPEFGLSEGLAGKATANTNNRPLAGTNAFYQGPGQPYLQVNQPRQNPVLTGDQLGAQLLANPEIQQLFGPAGGYQGSSKTSDNIDPFSAALGAGDFGSGATAGAQASYQPNYVTYGNQQFDLNDPGGRSSFFQAKQRDLATYRDQIQQQADQNATTATAQARDEYSRTLSSIDQQLADLDTQAKQYVNEYNQTKDKFSQDKSLGDVNRGQYFAGLGANAFQSSQATSQDYADQQYAQG